MAFTCKIVAHQNFATETRANARFPGSRIAKLFGIAADRGHGRANRAKPSVTIGGKAAEIAFSGLAPGTVGLNQVNVRIPEDASSGSSVAVILTSGGVVSDTVTIAIE